MVKVVAVGVLATRNVPLFPPAIAPAIVTRCPTVSECAAVVVTVTTGRSAAAALIVAICQVGAAAPVSAGVTRRHTVELMPESSYVTRPPDAEAALGNAL